MAHPSKCGRRQLMRSNRLNVLQFVTLFGIGGTERQLMRSNRLNVLQFVTLFGIGGTERQVLNLVQALDSSRFGVEVACLKRFGALLPEMEATGVPITEYKTTSLYNHIAVWNQMRFVNRWRKRTVEIVHSYGFHSNVFAIPPARLAGAAAENVGV